MKRENLVSRKEAVVENLVNNYDMQSEEWAKFTKINQKLRQVSLSEAVAAFFRDDVEEQDEDNGDGDLEYRFFQTVSGIDLI